MAENIHYCEDCKHPNGIFYCMTHPKETAPSFVQRDGSPQHVHCYVRNHDGKCKLFEQK